MTAIERAAVSPPPLSPIRDARLALEAAEKALREKPNYHAALVVQRLRRDYDAKRKLTVVK